MRKRSRIAFAMLAVACRGGITWLVLRHSDPEPVYQAKPLSYWLGGCRHAVGTIVFDQGKEPRREQADEAMRNAGTNATAVGEGGMTVKFVNHILENGE